MANAAAHFVARPDGKGGVNLTLRQRFRDADSVELGDDGIARKVGEALTKTSEAVERNRQNSTDENGDDPTEQIIHVFGPLLPGQTAELHEQDNGTIAVVLVSSPDELIGNTTLNNGGVVGDRRQGPRTRDAYVARTYGKSSEASKLAAINAANKAQYNR